MKNITIVLLETLWAEIFVCSVSKNHTIDILSKYSWDPGPYFTDTNGQRLIEEIFRRVSAQWEKNNIKSDCLVVSLPGTLRANVTVLSSSRLNIREPVEFSSILSRDLSIPCYIFNDAECLVTGEIKHGGHFQDSIPPSLVYILVDEGIGSKIILDGKQYTGMGTAGLLGRLIVQPEGAYFSALRSSGSLEAYSSRPSVSKRLVEVYISEINKKNTVPISEDAEYSKFRQALKATANSENWSQISYDRIASGLNDNDPIALHVIDYAAKYLGFTVNAVITIINPAVIILGGRMITELPGFADKTISYARQFSWPIAWNNTEIKASQHGRDIQVYGAVELLLSLLNQ